MEDLWRLKDTSSRLDPAGSAEYDLMLRRFQKEEEQKLKRDILYGGVPELAEPAEYPDSNMHPHCRDNLPAPSGIPDDSR